MVERMDALTVTPDWIGVDWGSSYVRAWAMSQQGEVLAMTSSPQGSSTLSSAQYETVLFHLIEVWLPTDKILPIIICGMAGSRQGGQEVAYQTLPITSPNILHLTSITTQSARFAVYMLAGLSQLQPADVMRGEETQIAGFLGDNPQFTGTLILPGTHSKWVHIQQGVVMNFSTCMTGELFHLLSTQSVLRHSVQSEAWSEAAFLQGFQNSFQQPEQFMANLFTLRADHLLQQVEPSIAKARLSGLLLGAECAAMRSKGFMEPHSPVGVIANPTLTQLYTQALQVLQLVSLGLNGERLTVNGLYSAYQKLIKCNP